METNLMSKLPVKEHIKNMKKILQVIWEMDRTYFPTACVVHLCNVAVSYLNLTLMSYVLNALQNKTEFMTLMSVVSAAIAGIFVLHAIAGILWNGLEVRRQKMYRQYNCMVEEKLLAMDFSKIDSPAVKELRDRIQRDNNWGAGLNSVFWQFHDIVYQVFNMTGAVIVGGYALRGVVRAVPVPASMLLIGLLFIGLLVMAAAGQKGMVFFQKKEDYFMHHRLTDEEKKTLAENCWSFSHGYDFSYQNGKDARLYQSYDLIKRWTADVLDTKPYRKRIRDAAAGAAGVAFCSEAVNGAIEGISYLIIALAALAGGIQTGSMVQLAGCLKNLLQNLYGITGLCTRFAMAARRQVSTLELLALENEMYQGKLPVEKRSDNEYEIEFCDVSFCYPGTDTYALRHFSLKLRIGEKLAIVGMNGSGKTTMIKLLCRLYDPQEGEILLNGVDIRKFKQEEYSRLFAVVFQDYKLFDLMLAQNVAVSTDYDRRHVESSLCDAGFGERLSGLKEGVETYLYKGYDDEGVEVSGGEAQKIALARAIYKDAPFILLDEPTAALDPIAEYEIYTSFDKIAGSKTAIYISHRLASCKFCDKIAVFHKGQLVQLGSHEELAADTSGKYYEMWNAQAQYYCKKGMEHIL